MMSPRLRQLALAAHLAVSVGWIGAVVAFLALVLAAMARDDALALRAAWMAMAWTGWYTIVPLAVLALLTGLVMSLGTKWGLLRHYWTLLSFALTVLATAILLGNMLTVSSYAGLAGTEGVGVDRLREGLAGELLHAGGGLAVLLAVLVLNVYKPPGLTAYGRRKLREGGSSPRP